MGGSSSSSGSSSQDLTTRYTLPTASAEEQDLRSMLSGLSDTQMNALSRELDRWTGATGGGSQFALSPQANQQLDAAFAPQLNRLNVTMRESADQLAGARGLRLSDTPIAERIANDYGAGLAQLTGGRAEAGLGLGLAANQRYAQNMLGLTGAIPGGAASLGQNYLQERLAGGTRNTTGWSTNTMNTSTDNTAQNVATGVGTAAAVATAAVAI